MDKNIFQSVVKKLQETKDKEGNFLNMDSIMVSHGSELFKHKFNNDATMNDLRSISKPIISIALGIAIDKGLVLNGEKIDLDTKIYPFFEDKVEITNKRNIEKWQKVTLKHVLTHSIGFADGLLFSKDIKDKDPFSLLEFIFNYEITYEPGTCFVYSNVGPYIISALIHEELGINLSDWVNQLLFQKIGITDFEWKNYGKYCAGATGLKMSHHDFHKVGLILLNKGMYNGHQLVSKQWIESMSTVQIKTPTMYDEKRVFPKYGYGFFVYICKNGRFYIDGSAGQYLIVLPEKDLLITTFGHQNDMKPITVCLRELL